MLGTILAVGMAVVLVLGAALAALISLSAAREVPGSLAGAGSRQEPAGSPGTVLRADPLPCPSQMCRARQNCGKHRHSWRQPGPLCCLTPVVLKAPARARQQCKGSRSSSDGGCRGCPWAGSTTGARSTSRWSGSPGRRRRSPPAHVTPARVPSYPCNPCPSPLLLAPLSCPCTFLPVSPLPTHPLLVPLLSALTPCPAGLPGTGGKGRILLDWTGGHRPQRLLALGGQGCLLPGPEPRGAAVLRTRSHLSSREIFMGIAIRTPHPSHNGSRINGFKTCSLLARCSLFPSCFSHVHPTGAW
ncbi:uncharacterized protein LOC121086401 isoform X2 [Falco naumanni]|uniref:uncharacterized protein LOC121086401 isoform X2 n=1 Tax=Falco naumanni TaxID=148594 RepID=UPI001ADE27B5|nr:uncharacterized protein LOC121086401 isoform X2 [Falco naumanni]